MKKIFKLAALVAASLAIFSCTPEDNPGNNEGENNGGENGNTNVTLNQNLKFTLGTPETEATQATVRVAHDGDKADTWYWIVTTESDVNAAVTAEVAKLTTPIQGLKKTTKTDVTVKNLEPETEYTFAVFGLSENGEVYGETKSVKFTTEQGDAGFTENPAWTIEYSGAKDYEYQGQTTTYKHTVTVTSTDDNPWFVSSAWTKDEFEETMETYGIEAILEYELGELKDYVDYYNQYYGTNGTVVDFLYTGTDWDVIDVIPGEWYVMAIGVGEDGELSGLYAISEVITITEEEATEAYSAWLGNWTFTSANGASYNVTFHKYINNEYYYMTGWQDTDMQELAVEVMWDPQSEMWAIYPMYFGQFSFDDGSKGEIYFLGAQQSGESYDLYTEYPICMGGYDTDGSRISIAYEEGEIKITHASYFFVNETGTPFFWDDPTLIPTFPITITPAESTEPAPAARSMAQPTAAKKQYTSKRCPKFMPARSFETYGTRIQMF